MTRFIQQIPSIIGNWNKLGNPEKQGGSGYTAAATCMRCRWLAPQY